MWFRLWAVLCLAALGTSTVATAKTIIQPIQVGAETIRWDQGEWVLDLHQPGGAVQLRAAASDHGSFAFWLMMLNETGRPLNFDVTNVRVEGAPVPVRLMTQQEMVKKAKSRAMWAALAVGLAGGLAAAAAANQTNHYTATTHTPRGTFFTHVTAPSVAGQVQAAAIAAGTGATMAHIQHRLDATRAGLKDNMVQLTTVDPGESYGGLIYLTKFKAKPPTEMRLIVRIGERDFPLGLRFAKHDAPQPQFRTVEAAHIDHARSPATAEPVTASTGTSSHTAVAPAATASAASAGATDLQAASATHNVPVPPPPASTPHTGTSAQAR